MIIQNIFPFFQKKIEEVFLVVLCEIIIFTMPALAVLMGLCYVTFSLNRFLANNNNLGFIGRSLRRKISRFCFRVFNIITFQKKRIFSSQHRQIVIGIVQRYYVV